MRALFIMATLAIGCASRPATAPVATAYLMLDPVSPLACYSPEQSWRAEAVCPRAPTEITSGERLLAVHGAKRPATACARPSNDPPLEGAVLPSLVLAGLELDRARDQGANALPSVAEIEQVDASQPIAFDLDGDGDGDAEVLSVVSADGDWGAIAMIVRHGAEPRVIAAEHEYHAELTTECADLDGDRRPEILVSWGAETEQSYALMQWDGARLRALGSVYIGEE